MAHGRKPALPPGPHAILLPHEQAAPVPQAPERRLPPTVGAQLRTARLQQGRTLVDLARVIGGNKGSLSAVETGAIRPPRLKKLLHWAQELGLSGEELAVQAWAQSAPREIRALVMERL